MASFTITRVTALAALAALAVTTVSGHGFTTMPRCRGAMKCNRAIPNPVLDDTAPIDTCPQCNSCGGVGETSKGGPWKVFAPAEYKREAITLCGDPVGSDAHTKTGKFANTANMPFAAMYAAGSVANFEYDITANHKGYLSFYLCDVSAGGDVENDPAFFKSNCHELEREPHAACEAGTDKDCGPIDPKYPGRFVIPCGDGDYVFGGDSGKMAYRIPSVQMQEAVVVTYWMAANSCLPTDGFLQNYNYPAAWGGCGTPGMGLSACGGVTPEEFFSCSDISVTGGASGGASPAEVTEAPADAAATVAPYAATSEAQAPAAPVEVPYAGTVAPYAATSEAQAHVATPYVPYARTMAPTEAPYVAEATEAPYVATDAPYVAQTTAYAAAETTQKPAVPVYGTGAEAVDELTDKVVETLDEETPAKGQGGESPVGAKKAGGDYDVASITQCLSKCLSF